MKKKFKKVVEYEDMDLGRLVFGTLGMLILGLTALFDKTVGYELINMFVSGVCLAVCLMGIMNILVEVINSRKVYWEEIK